jgi:hypothetical protein
MLDGDAKPEKTPMNREMSVLSLFVACLLALGLSACGSRLRTSAPTANADKEFAAFLSIYDEAIREFAKGRPAKVKDLWSRRALITLPAALKRPNFDDHCDSLGP